jgi:hypothetical protein
MVSRPVVEVVARRWSWWLWSGGDDGEVMDGGLLLAQRLHLPHQIRRQNWRVEQGTGKLRTQSAFRGGICGELLLLAARFAGASFSRRPRGGVRQPV